MKERLSYLGFKRRKGWIYWIATENGSLMGKEGKNGPRTFIETLPVNCVAGWFYYVDGAGYLWRSRKR
jgi:hypothetical protein